MCSCDDQPIPRETAEKILKVLAEWYQSDRYKRSQEWITDLTRRNQLRMEAERTQKGP